MRLALAGGNSGNVYMYQGGACKLVAALPCKGIDALEAEGETLYAASKKDAQIFKINSDSSVFAFPSIAGISGLCVHGDKLIGAGMEADFIHVYNKYTGEHETALPAGRQFTGFAVAPPFFAAAASENQAISFFSLTDWRVQSRQSLPHQPLSLQYYAPQNMLLAGCVRQDNPEKGGLLLCGVHAEGDNITQSAETLAWPHALCCVGGILAVAGAAPRVALYYAKNLKAAGMLALPFYPDKLYACGQTLLVTESETGLLVGYDIKVRRQVFSLTAPVNYLSVSVLSGSA